MRNYLNLTSQKPRTRYGMAEYLKNHPGHADGWAGPLHFSRCIKITHIQDTTHDEDDKCLAQLENPWALSMSGFNDVLEEFEKEHRGYVIYQAGRSGGHLELHNMHGDGFYPSRTDDYSDFSWEDLKDLFNLVWDFDQTCQAAVDSFVDFANNWEVVTE